jgi:hypothetical protein
LDLDVLNGARLVLNAKRADAVGRPVRRIAPPAAGRFVDLSHL